MIAECLHTDCNVQGELKKNYSGICHITGQWFVTSQHMKVKFTLEQAIKAQRRSQNIALLFL
jgi:hypothetical protein